MISVADSITFTAKTAVVYSLHSWLKHHLGVSENKDVSFYFFIYAHGPRLKNLYTV